MSWFYGMAVVYVILKVRKKADVWCVGRKITCQEVMMDIFTFSSLATFIMPPLQTLSCPHPPCY